MDGEDDFYPRLFVVLQIGSRLLFEDLAISAGANILNRMQITS